MTLNEAIEYYDSLAEECRQKASIERNDYMDLRDESAEYSQLSEWLAELEVLREKVNCSELPNSSDLVSRSYLLAEYDRQHQGPPGGARKIIEEAPPVQDEQKWIPCKVKMPDPDQLVLMQCRGKKWPSGYRYFQVLGVWIPPLTVKAEEKWTQDSDTEDLEVYDEDTDTYYCEAGWYEETTQGDGDNMSWKMNADVIAWMPLPAAYKGGTDEGQTD